MVLVEDYGSKAYGKYVVIKHADRWVTWYAHLSGFRVKEGDSVRRGDVIGLSGNTGNSDGAHLHLTVQHFGHGESGYWLLDVVDPLPLLL